MTTEMGIAAPTRAARRRRLPGLVALGLLGGVAAFVAPHLAAANNADAPTRPGSIDVRQQIQCLAKTIYFEARGEPDAGKLAVGHVVMNRVASDDYPDTVCEVMQQGGEDNLHRCQFSFYCDGRSDDPEDKAAWRHSQALARAVFWDFSPDPTGGARWYHADYVSPDWRNQFDKGPVIGQHVFYLAPGDHESETDTDAGSPQQVAERPEPEQDKLAGATNETSPSSP